MIRDAANSSLPQRRDLQQLTLAPWQRPAGLSVQVIVRQARHLACYCRGGSKSDMRNSVAAFTRPYVFCYRMSLGNDPDGAPQGRDRSQKKTRRGCACIPPGQIRLSKIGTPVSMPTT
jgi:hypothetical protein